MRPQHEKYAWSGEESQFTNTTNGGGGGESSSSSSNAATMRVAGNRQLIARVVVVSESFFGLRFNTENCLTASSSSDRSLVTSKLYSRANNFRNEVFKIHLFNAMVNSAGRKFDLILHINLSLIRIIYLKNNRNTRFSACGGHKHGRNSGNHNSSDIESFEFV